MNPHPLEPLAGIIVTTLPFLVIWGIYLLSGTPVNFGL